MWIILLLSLISSAWAIPVLHLIKPDSNFTQITTLDACGTYTYSLDIVGCNPALFPYHKDEGLRMGLATITDGESVEVGQKLLLDPIKQDFLRRLFQQQSFNSWGANSFIELRTSKFFISYDPLLVNADVFVFNPASPEIAMSLIKSNRLRVTTGLELINNDALQLSFGTKVYYFRVQSFQDSFFLSDLVGKDIDDLINFEKESGIAGDMGAMVRFKTPFLPKLSLLIKNLNSPIKNEDSDIISETQLRPLLTYETYSRIGLGYDYKANWGSLNGEVSFPFKDVYSEFYSEYVSASIGYALSRFSAQAAFSKYQKVFGFDFGSKLASVGIFYAYTQPLGDFSEQTENLGGVRLQVSL